MSYRWRTVTDHGNSGIGCSKGGIDCAFSGQIRADCEALNPVGLILFILEFFLTFWMVTVNAYRLQLQEVLVGFEIPVETISSTILSLLRVCSLIPMFIWYLAPACWVLWVSTAAETKNNGITYCKQNSWWQDIHPTTSGKITSIINRLHTVDVIRSENTEK